MIMSKMIMSKNDNVKNDNVKNDIPVLFYHVIIPYQPYLVLFVGPMIISDVLYHRR